VNARPAKERIWTLIKRLTPTPLSEPLRRLRNILRPSEARDPKELTRDALLTSHSQISGFELVVIPGSPHRSNEALDASFYDRQHLDAQYRQNNWLLDQVPVLKRANPGTVIEVGCGNGRFLRAMAPHVRKVIGIDWAFSPELTGLPGNVQLLRLDIVSGQIPAGDLICSADVLEHLAPRDVEPVVAKLTRTAAYQHHVIACYDDGHSHLSILPPVAWFALFRKHSPDIYLSDVYCRRNDPSQIVCIVSNLSRG